MRNGKHCFIKFGLLNLISYGIVEHKWIHSSYNIGGKPSICLRKTCHCARMETHFVNPLISS